MFFGSHFEHLLAIFVVLLVRAKGQNTVIYNVSVYLSIHDYIFIFLSIYPVSVDIDRHLYMDRYICYIYIIYVYADIYVCVHPHPDQETGGGGGPPARRDVGPPSPLVVPPAPSQQAKRAELAGTTSSTNCPPAKKKARARHNKPKLAHE